MGQLVTEIEINARAEKVWGVLVDFSSYPKWNPFIRSTEGEPVVGSKLKVFLQPSGSRGMTFKPDVLAADPQRELRWVGKLFVSALFAGEHIFTIEPLIDGGVKFTQSENFSGLLVPLFWKSLDTDTRRGFNEMNAAMKERAERSVTK